jgi:hypothetical protein
MDQLERIHEILRDAVHRGELWAYSDLAEVESLLEEQETVFELAAWMREQSRHDKSRSKEEAEAAFQSFFAAHAKNIHPSTAPSKNRK